MNGDVSILAIQSSNLLITAIESWDTLSKKVTDHELLAAIWFIHHQSALWSKSVVNDTFFVTFQGNITSRAVFEGTIVAVEFCLSSECHCDE